MKLNIASVAILTIGVAVSPTAPPIASAQTTSLTGRWLLNRDASQFPARSVSRRTGSRKRAAERPTLVGVAADADAAANPAMEAAPIPPRWKATRTPSECAS